MSYVDISNKNKKVWNSEILVSLRFGFSWFKKVKKRSFKEIKGLRMSRLGF